MARYYFHIVDGKTFNDYRGQEFPDDAAAMQEAGHYAKIVARAGAHVGDTSIRVSDNCGREVGRVPVASRSVR